MQEGLGLGCLGYLGGPCGWGVGCRRPSGALPTFDHMTRNKRWAKGSSDTTINVVTDNTQVLYMVNSGCSKNRVCMGLLRELFWTCFVFNVDVFAFYIASADNILADVCLLVCGISLTSGQLVSELFPDCTRSCFSQIVLCRRGR